MSLQKWPEARIVLDLGCGLPRRWVGLRLGFSGLASQERHNDEHEREPGSSEEYLGAGLGTTVRVRYKCQC